MLFEEMFFLPLIVPFDLLPLLLLSDLFLDFDFERTMGSLGLHILSLFNFRRGDLVRFILILPSLGPFALLFLFSY